MRREAPRVGGSFAVWGGLFSTFDCALIAARHKEDPWNSIAAGALTGGFLQLRTGPASAARAAAFGGVLLAMIEGLGIMLTKMTAPPPAPPMLDVSPPPEATPVSAASAPAPSVDAPAAEPASGGWLGSWFGGGGGGGEAAPAAPTDLSSDPFAPPPMPAELAGGEAGFR